MAFLYRRLSGFFAAAPATAPATNDRLDSDPMDIDDDSDDAATAQTQQRRYQPERTVAKPPSDEDQAILDKFVALAYEENIAKAAAAEAAAEAAEAAARSNPAPPPPPPSASATSSAAPTPSQSQSQSQQQQQQPSPAPAQLWPDEQENLQPTGMQRQRLRVLAQHTESLPEARFLALVSVEETRLLQKWTASSLHPRLWPGKTTRRAMAAKIIWTRWRENFVWADDEPDWTIEWMPRGDWMHERVDADLDAVQIRTFDQSRPFYQFMHEVAAERNHLAFLARPPQVPDRYAGARDWTFRNKDSPLRNLVLEAYRNVRYAHWEARGIWDHSWGLLPGMQWKHEMHPANVADNRVTGVGEWPQEDDLFSLYGSRPNLFLRRMAEEEYLPAGIIDGTTQAIAGFGYPGEQDEGIGSNRPNGGPPRPFHQTSGSTDGTGTNEPPSPEFIRGHKVLPECQDPAHRRQMQKAALAASVQAGLRLQDLTDTSPPPEGRQDSLSQPPPRLTESTPPVSAHEHLVVWEDWQEMVRGPTALQAVPEVSSSPVRPPPREQAAPSSSGSYFTSESEDGSDQENAAPRLPLDEDNIASLEQEYRLRRQLERARRRAAEGRRSPRNSRRVLGELEVGRGGGRGQGEAGAGAGRARGPGSQYHWPSRLRRTPSPATFSEAAAAQAARAASRSQSQQPEEQDSEEPSLPPLPRQVLAPLPTAGHRVSKPVAAPAGRRSARASPGAERRSAHSTPSEVAQSEASTTRLPVVAPGTYRLSWGESSSDGDYTGADAAADAETEDDLETELATDASRAPSASIPLSPPPVPAPAPAPVPAPPAAAAVAETTAATNVSIKKEAADKESPPDLAKIASPPPPSTPHPPPAPAQQQQSQGKKRRRAADDDDDSQQQPPLRRSKRAAALRKPAAK